jgi:uncharacterized protein YijF (DUF1287 family)
MSFRTLLPAVLCSIACVAASADDAGALVEAARARTRVHEVYDGAYRSIPYPNGDVPADRGVCTDLVIRAYRALGIDLQQRVHEDMRAHFDEYPKQWGLRRPDTNIDHRRVPNLQVYFVRAGASLPAGRDVAGYVAGDLVTWMLPGNLPHIGIVSDRRVAGTERPLILHNIGAGPVEDDILFAYPITGHYRWFGGSDVSRDPFDEPEDRD